MIFKTPKEAFPHSATVAATVHKEHVINYDHRVHVRVRPGLQHVPVEVAHHWHFKPHATIHDFKLNEPAPVETPAVYPVGITPEDFEDFEDVFNPATTASNEVNTDEAPADPEVIEAPVVKPAISEPVTITKPATVAAPLRRPVPPVRRR